MHMQVPMQQLAVALPLQDCCHVATLPLKCYPTCTAAGFGWQLLAVPQQPHTLMLLPTFAAPVTVEPHPFRSKEHTTASGASDKHTLTTAVPGSSDPRSSGMREPRRPFGRLTMPDRMDRCSGAPPLQLGWVTRGARPSGEATNARARPETTGSWDKRLLRASKKLRQAATLH